MKLVWISRRNRLSAVRPAFAFIFCLVAAAAAFLPISARDGLEPLVVTGDFTSAPPAAVPDTIRMVTYNLHGPPSEQIEAVAGVLKNHPALSQAHIFSLQEVNRDHAGSDHRDVGRELAQMLGMHYVYAIEAPHREGGGVRGLAFLSRFPLRDAVRIELPVEGPGGRHRIALGVTIELGDKRLRLYDLHLETRISAEERGEQISGILEDAERHSHLPAVILGDFNTLNYAAIGKMEDLMREAGFERANKGDKLTFRSRYIVALKLDWIWTRHVQTLATAVESKIKASDHRPVWVEIDTTSMPTVPLLEPADPTRLQGPLGDSGIDGSTGPHF